MKIYPIEIKIKDLIKDFKDLEDNGVYAYNGKLNIRPPYQREFIYNDKDQDKVIHSVLNNFPLNSMYWYKIPGGKYEILDGQQRTLSICYFCYMQHAYNGKIYYDSLTDEDVEKILNYKLHIYICDGTNKEKLNWFRTINIAGKVLNDQELKNAVYAGKWLTDAKRYFSKKNGAGENKSKNYTDAVINRQDLLEQVLLWISDRDNTNIEEYMSKHQNYENANDLWKYFEDVIDWVQKIFYKEREAMKKVQWGLLYNKHKNDNLDPDKLEKEINELMLDREVRKKEGIYEYLLDPLHQEKYLNLRTFDESQKITAYTKQNGICKKCGKHCKINEMQADHIIPWSKGGKTVDSNLQMLCAECNWNKSDK